MKLLSNGYKLPEDRDVEFFEYLVFNIQRLNDHTHDGVNSNQINLSSVSSIVERVNSGWELHTNGIYRKLLTCPEGYEFEDLKITIRNYTDKEIVYSTLQKVSANTFYIYVPYDDADLEVIYG